MIFWVIVIALLGLGLCAVLIPLTKLNEVSGNSADYDREVYKAQLAELDRDVLSGPLSESEAQASRTEIARRLLIADRSSNEIEMQKRPTQSGRAIIIATAILIRPRFLWPPWPAGITRPTVCLARTGAPANCAARQYWNNGTAFIATIRSQSGKLRGLDTSCPLLARPWSASKGLASF